MNLKLTLLRISLAAGLGCLLGFQALAQGSARDYSRADSLRGGRLGAVEGERLHLAWSPDGARLAYVRSDAVAWDPLEEQAQPVVRSVELASGVIEAAFDHAGLIEACVARGFDELVSRGALRAGSIADLEFLPGGELALLLASGDHAWVARGGIGPTRIERASGTGPFALTPRAPGRSSGGRDGTSLFFVNPTTHTVSLEWIDPEGRRSGRGVLAPGQSARRPTYAGHVWELVSEAGDSLGFYEAQARARVVKVPEASEAPEASPPETDAPRSAPGEEQVARLVLEDGAALWIDPAAGTRTVIALRGAPAGATLVGPLVPSPDGRFVALYLHTAGQGRVLQLVESSPSAGLQPVLHSYPYLKPGDAIPQRKPLLFDVEARELRVLDDALFPNPWQIDTLRWAPDSERFFFRYNQRGHQLLRWLSVSAPSGEVTAVFEETSETFIDYSQKGFVRYLPARGEVLWMSERSGFNHLYRFDATRGELLSAVTSGDWVLRAVERVDEERGELWFRAMGVFPDQDPYHVHHGRVGLDGRGLTWLTRGDGTHELSFAPGGEFYVDSWSRVDLPPVHELRRSRDGALIAELERADATRLATSGWRAPERFAAPGRDGSTPIWGVIYTPTNFDSRTHYPVIEQIYAGPHGFFVPKRFRSYHGPEALAELGFVVVQIDGMGTNWRSRAFHDVAWKNLKDAGLPDRIAWMRAAAETRPWMDLSRVGIYGGSAGGQSALRAVLDHHDFYRAAAADCGCHDNRMDKVWWNEAWMGWPLDASYDASSNVLDAHRLGAPLLLTVGELDSNVDPASTMQVVKALIEADKDFELIVFPGKGHGAGGSAYGIRRRRDFFVRHLLGVEPRW